MKKFYLAAGISFLTSVVVLTGCSLLSPGRLTVKEYDLTVPAVPAPALTLQLQLGAIGNASGAGQSLLHRGAGSVMTHDERHRLYQPLEAILAREFRRCFGSAPVRQEKTGDRVQLSGNILKFEIDDTAKRAVLEMEVVLDLYSDNARRSRVHRLICCQAPLKDDSAESAWAAQGQCVGQLLTEIGRLMPDKNGLFPGK